MKVAKATSVEYYTSGGGVASGMESYYLDAVTEGEPPGLWLGAGAAAMGLSGEVDAEDMKTLYGQFVNPVTGEQFGSRPAQRRSVEERMEAKLAAEPGASAERIEEIRATTREQSNVIGWDATLSVPKSVSAVHTAAHRGELAATRAGDTDRAQAFAFVRTQIEDAISEANAAGLAAAERVVTARAAGGPGGATQWVGAKGIVVASFFQHTNRSIDPHLHVHNVILNRVMCEDGKVRALDGDDLLAQQYLFSAVADRSLSESLAARLGFEMQDRSDGAGREIALVPQEVIDHFSTRAQQTTKAMAPLVAEATERLGRELTNTETARLHRAAQRSSRAAKSHQGESAAELNERWWAQLLADTGISMDRLGDDVLQATTAYLAARLEHPDAATATVEWSPQAVIAQAVAACSTRKATWGRANLISELELHLPPVLGIDISQIPKLLESLADQAIADVVQVGGIGSGVYAAPSATVYAADGTLAAETALRRAAISRGCASLPAEQVAAWLDENCPSIGADQRAAVEGIASSDAAITVLVGPAGTGKSYAAGALAGAWQDLHEGQGRLIGLAVSQAATRVLVDDGVSAARNVTEWLRLQDCLAEGSTHPDHVQWQLNANDMVMIDEASMVSTANLEAIRAKVQAAGARLVLTGDPRQLASVEAGGVMELLEGHAETYTLTDVRRFANDWERDASLALRDGDAQALAEYDRHGRILGHAGIEEATAAAARAAVADRVDGRSVVVVTSTNAQAATVAAQVREQLIELGLVHADGGVLTGRDGNTASIGDIITCRRNAERSIGVTNQVQYEVIDTPAPGTDPHDDGWLLVRPVPGPGPEQGAPIRIPSAYVAEHVQLGYASTVHSAQGLTVDSAHLVAGGWGWMDLAALYVALSRGRYDNTAHVALAAPPDTTTAPSAATPGGGRVTFENTSSKASARAVLEAALTDANDAARAGKRPADRVAATIAAERAAAHENSMATITARQDAETRRICRARTERHLDDLVASGDLDEATRARLSADQGVEHLSRLLRATEQAGHDPRHVLTEAITAPQSTKNSLEDATSVAQVLSHRITRHRDHLQPLENPVTTAFLPADIPAADVERLTQLHTKAVDRRAALGQITAQQAPEWAVQTLGPVPDTAQSTDRADWERRAGTIAAHRKAVGWEHPTQALDRMPGLSATERRLSFTAAWDAAGRPDTTLDEATLTDGQVLNRISAWKRELATAPPHADAQLRHAETSAQSARQNAALAEAAAQAADLAGDHTQAQQLRDEAAAHRQTATVKSAAAEQLTQIAQTRSTWSLATSGTRAAYDRAVPEAERRGLTPGHEPDRTTVEDWLQVHQHEQASADEHQPITETDLPQISDEDARWALSTAPLDEHSVSVPELVRPAPSVAAEDTTATDAHQQPVAARSATTPDVSITEVEAMAATAALALSRMDDRTSQESAHSRDEQDATQIESLEAGRRRRDAADFDAGATHSSTATRDHTAQTEVDDDLGN